MAPAHRVCVQYVEVVARYDLLERFASTIVTSKEVNLVSDQVCGVAAQALGWTTENLRLCPGESLGVENMKVLEMLVPGVAPEEIELVAEHCHCVCISCHWDHSGNLWLNPGHSIEIENVDIIEALVAIVAPEHV